MIWTIFTVSASMSIIIVLLLIIIPFLNKHYSIKWRYFLWLVISIRLIIPFKIDFVQAPIKIPYPTNTVVYSEKVYTPNTVYTPIKTENYQDATNNLASSDNTAPSFKNPSPTITLQELLMLLWAIGSSGFFLYHILNFILFKHRIKQFCYETNNENMKDLLNQMNIKKAPKFMQCSKISSPMMIGFFKPIILLPDTKYSNDELLIILKHELTHLKRFDIWYKLLLIIVNSVHFFNPIVYLMVKQANRDLEYLCDDEVIKNSDIDFRKKYSFAILKTISNKGPSFSLNLSKRR